MTTFKDIMKEAIRVYRQRLRKQLTQVQRIQKLNDLNLRKKNFEDFSDKELYDLGCRIIYDIESKTPHPDSYYAYSGMARFAEYLKNFLSNYVLEDGQVIHCLQKASNALVRAIQLLALEKEALTDTIKQELMECQLIIERFGSPTHKKNLTSLIEKSQKAFYKTQVSFLAQNSRPALFETPNKV